MARLLLCAFLAVVGAIDNGLGRTPPMGWRSWNLYGANVNQSLMQRIMDGMVSKKRKVDGVPTSLCDLGYCDVGLDDNWQDCKAGHQYHYHDDAGIPIINRERFPDMITMTSHAHQLNLTSGWYLNNCICSEQAVSDSLYHSDVAALTVFGFDAVKLDGCGRQKDLDKWADLFNKTGRPIMIENCHWGGTVPNATWCPWNFFRTSGDVRASYGSIVGNLLTTVEWAQKNLSKPGCWAYPDMLEVGCQHGPGGAGDPGLTFFEARSHFSAWAIVSSPLTLSLDVNNDTVMDAVWEIIANKEIIAVNQAWAGHSGSPFKQADSYVQLTDFNMEMKGTIIPHNSQVPSWQFFYKPMGGGKIVVLLMNHDSKAQDLTLTFSDVPGLSCQKCKVRCLYVHSDLGEHDGTFVAKGVPSHDSRMFMLSSSGHAAVQKDVVFM
mmetsp:Transcript_78475/g.123763  ORF Transcript_78475/g.123763 Transcript_78475/m.123763 type:complete len:435 (-) Transcript_78475:248-1552(-)